MIPRVVHARRFVFILQAVLLVVVLALGSCWKADPGLVVSTSLIDFGASKESIPISVRNAGEDNRLTDGVTPLDYQFKCDHAWVSVTPASGTCGGQEKATHTVAVDRTKMVLGENVATISVTSNGGSATIKVTAIRETPSCGIPPSAPVILSPKDGASGVGAPATLSWTAGNSYCAGFVPTYDVYFGAASPPPFHHNNGTLKSWDPGPLTTDTAYYWRIVARDGTNETSGPEWSFRTASTCTAGPAEVTLIAPADLAQSVPVTTGISWAGGQSQCAGLVSGYDVYFGATTPAPFHHHTATMSWDAGPLAGGTTYYWRVVATDDNGTSSSAERSFTTAPDVCTTLPSAVTLLSPASQQTGVVLQQDLSWSGGDSQCPGLTASYDVYFGTTSPAPSAATGLAAKTWDPGLLNDDTVYYWKIVAKDDNGSRMSEERWFHTACTLLPSVAAVVSPANGAAGTGINDDLSWSGGESRCPGLSATYDVYFGTSATPPFHHNNGASKSWDPGTLAYQTAYYWKIVTKDANGATGGPVWSFVTEAAPCVAPPSAPCSPSPGNGKTNVNRGANLAWGCGTSPCGLVVTYDVYFGTTPTPGDAQKLGSTTSTSWPLPELGSLTTYYWKVVAHDANGTTSGPVWHFMTRS